MKSGFLLSDCLGLHSASTTRRQFYEQTSNDEDSVALRRPSQIGVFVIARRLNQVKFIISKVSRSNLYKVYACLFQRDAFGIGMLCMGQATYKCVINFGEGYNPCTIEFQTLNGASQRKLNSSRKVGKIIIIIPAAEKF